MDSDEEYDRRRGRDKFKRERSDFQDRHAGRRDDWPESRDSNQGWGSSSNRDKMSSRSGNREYFRDNYGSSQRRDRYGSPGDRSDMSPPMKRGRGSRDWDERMSYPSANQDYNHPSWPGFDPSMPSLYTSGMSTSTQHQSTGPTQPPMNTFKQYLATLDDSVDDMEAVRKYNEYKTNFKLDQILDFFAAHKDDEWFKSRYHPDEFAKRKEEQQNSLKRRLEVFLDLFAKGWIDSVSIDVEKSDHIIRLLDAAVIKLEGGTDFDLQSLDVETEVDQPKEPELSLFSVDVEKPTKKENNNVQDEKEEGEEEEEGEEKKVTKQEDDDEKEESKENLSQDPVENKELKTEPAIKMEPDGNENSVDICDEKKSPAQEVKKSEDGEELEEGEEAGTTDDEKIKMTGDLATSEKMDSETSEVKEASLPEEPKPRPLHKKDSIFLRNIAPNITKAHIEEMCKQFPGFLRVALADPAPDRKFYRRGWVTFEKLGKIKDIWWQISSMKLKNCELGAIVNRDLTRRIRSVNGFASHKSVVRTDIGHAAKIIYNLDKQRNLWPDDTSGEKTDEPEEIPAFGLKSSNPLLKNIDEHMIEETTAEEEELLGKRANDDDDKGSEGLLERDENLIKVLDRLLLYLRIVHSVDYYNHSDYPNEDEMPNRIGIMHARGTPPSSKLVKSEINDYIRQFEAKLKPFLQPPVEDEVIKLGKRNAEKEIEQFIEDNTKEVDKDKWLCPLSGKKFKGPDFVRKHILNKHSDRLTRIREECEYFNNYLMDPKQIQLPEHPFNRPQNTPQSGPSDGINPNGSPALPLWHAAGYPNPAQYLHAYPRGPPLLPNPVAAWTNLCRNLGPPPFFSMDPKAMNRGRGKGSKADSRGLVGYDDLDDKLDMI